LLRQVWHRRRLKGQQGEIAGSRISGLRQMLDSKAVPEPRLGRLDQNNSTVFFGEKFVLKLFRRLEAGINPELELSGFLTRKGFPNSTPVVGALEYSSLEERRFNLGMVSEFILNSEDARAYTLDALGRYYDRVITWVAQGREAPPRSLEAIRLLQAEIPSEVKENIGTYLESARLLAVRTAELHLALASAVEGEEMAPEAFSPHHQRGLFQSMRNIAVQHFRLLRRQLKGLPPELASLAQKAVGLEGAVLECYRSAFESRLSAKRIRIHGDCHLGQVLWTGKDFVFIDFEGDPLVAISERRIKRSPLRDVVCLVRSFNYAAYAGLHRHMERGSIPQENLPKFESWVRYWNLWVGAVFLKAYFNRLGNADLLPRDEGQLRGMLRAYLLNQVMGELGRELGQPSAWLKIPLQSIGYLIGDRAQA